MHKRKRLILASKSKYRKAQLKNLGLDFIVKAPNIDETKIKKEFLSSAFFDLKINQEKRNAKKWQVNNRQKIITIYKKLAQQLAQKKALSVAILCSHHAKLSDSLIKRNLIIKSSYQKNIIETFIIGSDQLVVVDGELLSKPKNYNKAFLQLKKLSNKTHDLITAVVVLKSNFKKSKISHSFLKNKSLIIFDHVEVAQVTFKKLTNQQIKNYLLLDKPYDCVGSYKIEKGGLALIKSIRVADFSSLQGLPVLATLKGLEKLGYF